MWIVDGPLDGRPGPSSPLCVFVYFSLFLCVFGCTHTPLLSAGSFLLDIGTCSDETVMADTHRGLTKSSLCLLGECVASGDAGGQFEAWLLQDSR